ncbi:MAG: DNA-directed RNA polymerase subunit delta [Chitinophagaceae bacterium]|nr:MAG: DNA-directed RNA polymerase subunit delta [Chitinophagaceae bacterium]
MSIPAPVNFLRIFLTCIISILLTACGAPAPSALVLQSDFGLKDGAVNEMKAIAYSIDPKLSFFDLTHEIPPYNIWEAAYRLQQSAPYWPKGTVFVSVVDPGVGTDRKSVVMRSKTGHYFVTPDNGTLHFVASSLGIDQVRQIDETINRRQGSSESYTFHGRDVYVYTAARLASGKITIEEVGPRLPDSVVQFEVLPPKLSDTTITGNIPVLDPQYGNVWTNIPDSLCTRFGIKAGDSLHVRIIGNNDIVFEGNLVMAKTFGDVPVGKALGYINSLMNLSFAINEGNFADSFRIKNGPQWKVVLSHP